MNTTTTHDDEGVATPDNPDWVGMTGPEIVAHEFDLMAAYEGLVEVYGSIRHRGEGPERDHHFAIAALAGSPTAVAEARRILEVAG